MSENLGKCQCEWINPRSVFFVVLFICRQWYKDDLCALAFKVLHDKCRGPLVFVRVYSGSLKPQSAVYNINKSCT